MTDYEFKTVPNQKVARINKEICDNRHLYAKINLDAMHNAAGQVPLNYGFIFQKTSMDIPLPLVAKMSWEILELKLNNTIMLYKN